MNKYIRLIFLILILAPGLCWAEVVQSPVGEVVETLEELESLEVLDSPEVMESAMDIDSSEIAATSQLGETVGTGVDNDSWAYASANGEEDGQGSGSSSSGCVMSARTLPGATGWALVFLLSLWCLQRRKTTKREPISRF